MNGRGGMWADTQALGGANGHDARTGTLLELPSKTSLFIYLYFSILVELFTILFYLCLIALNLSIYPSTYLSNGTNDSNVPTETVGFINDGAVAGSVGARQA